MFSVMIPGFQLCESLCPIVPLKKNSGISDVMVVSSHLLGMGILHGKPSGGRFVLSPGSYLLVSSLITQIYRLLE